MIGCKMKKLFFPFLLSLIKQCDQNQYVWEITGAEKSRLAGHKIKLEKVISGDIQSIWNLSLALLYDVSYLQKLSQFDTQDIKRIRPKMLGEFLFETIENNKIEQEIATEIKSYSELEDNISQKVAKQYEQSPYPRWTSLEIGMTGNIRNSLNAYFRSSKLDFMDKNFDVLIAGCGTGQQAARAAYLYGENATITAIDISKPSLAYAKRVCDQYGIKNIQFAQADILEIHQIGKKFDVIECIGVLHHMAEPFTGWEKLVSQLKPHGLMYIGLYSEVSRKNIAALHAEADYPGPGCSNDQARNYRAQLMSRDDGALGTELLISWDFYALHEFRDLVLHENEHHIQIPQIDSFLDKSNLTFRGFTLDPYTHLEFKQEFPDDPLPGSLKNWEKFEHKNMRTFDAMYMFWCDREEK